jgi:DNA-binding CsgD family transcriptional regulator
MDATVDREPFGLSVREFQCLDYLRTHRGRIVPGWELREAVLGQFSADGMERVWVQRIRLKLSAAVIVTVEGMGYRFGIGRVAEALPRCPSCGRAVARYEEIWQCYACGAHGERKTLDLAVDLEVGRAAPPDDSRSGRGWSDEEREYIVTRRDERNDRQMADELNRSPSGVRAERKRLERERGLPKKRYVSGDDE